MLDDFRAENTYTSLEDFRHVAQNPKQKAMLEMVIDHSRAEVGADLDGVMVTLGDNPVYHDWGVMLGASEDTGPKGMAEVKANYEAMVANGSYVIDSNKERVMITDDNICTEGSFRQILTGDVARSLGYDAEDGYHVLRARTVVFWSFDDEGKVVGEDRYVVPLKLEQIAEADLPAHYPAHLKR